MGKIPKSTEVVSSFAFVSSSMILRINIYFSKFAFRSLESWYSISCFRINEPIKI